MESNQELNGLLENVKNLFMRYGIKSVTMDDVARELGISKKTLYLHVSNKEDLVEKVLEHIHNTYHNSEGEICEMGQLNAIEVLMKVNDIVTRMMQDHNPSMQYDLKKYYPDIANKFFEARNKEIFYSIIDNIEHGKREGLYREGINGELIAKLYISRINTITDDDVFTIDELRAPDFFRTIMELHIRSLATPKGIKVLEKELERYNN